MHIMGEANFYKRYSRDKTAEIGGPKNVKWDRI